MTSISPPSVLTILDRFINFNQKTAQVRTPNTVVIETQLTQSQIEKCLPVNFHIELNNTDSNLSQYTITIVNPDGPLPFELPLFFSSRI